MYTHEVPKQNLALEKLWQNPQGRHHGVGQIEMLWQCLINHSTIFLFNNYAIMEKEKDLNFLAKKVQKSVDVIAFVIFANCWNFLFSDCLLYNDVLK